MVLCGFQELSEFSDTDPAMVQAMLNSTQSPVSSMTASSCPCSGSPSMMYPGSGYPGMESAPNILLTTSSPQQQSGDSTTVTQTTLPPVQRPGNNTYTGCPKKNEDNKLKTKSVVMFIGSTHYHFGIFLQNERHKIDDKFT